MVDGRTHIKRWINKTIARAERAGENFDSLYAEVKKERCPLPPGMKVPPGYAERFSRFVADNQNRRKTKYPWFDVVAYGLGLNMNTSLTDADRERMTEEKFKMPDPDDPRTARRLFHKSTKWFPKE